MQEDLTAGIQSCRHDAKKVHISLLASDVFYLAIPVAFI